MTRIRYCLFVLAMLPLQALSQQEVTFPQAPSERLPIWRGYGENVTAVLTLPTNATGKVPAVVLVHTRGGYDPARYEYYGAALRQAGIATLGLILFRSGPTHLPANLVPHAFGALKYLASHPAIDSNRIAIMGFSMGGILALYTSSAILAAEHMGDGPRYAAHVAFYPVCWIHDETVRGSPRIKMLPGIYRELTGAPVKILAGGKDQWDDPDSCQRFIDALAPGARKAVSLVYFPTATHDWDSGRDGRVFGPQACKGTGCYVDTVYDPGIAAKGRQVALEFLSSVLPHADGK